MSGVDVGGLDRDRTRTSPSGRASLVVETAASEPDRGRGALLVAEATPLARRAVRRAVRRLGWDGPWRGTVEVLSDPTLAVAGGTLRRARRPGEANTFDLALRLPYAWLETVLRPGWAVFEDEWFVAAVEVSAPAGPRPPETLVAHVLSWAADPSVEGGDRPDSRGSYLFALEEVAVTEPSGDPTVVFY